MTSQELRKHVVNISGAEFLKSTELEVHEQGVTLAVSAEPGGKRLHKALEQRHALQVKRFHGAKTESEVAALWEAAKQAGDIPGAYWAVLTHPAITPKLCHGAFGDVHMLSHFVAAANRADIRRLTELQNENAELLLKIEKQQEHLRNAIVSRDQTIQGLRNELALRISSEASNTAPSDRPSDSELQVHRDLVESLKRERDTALARCARAIERAAQFSEALAVAQGTLARISHR